VCLFVLCMHCYNFYIYIVHFELINDDNDEESDDDDDTRWKPTNFTVTQLLLIFQIYLHHEKR